MIYSLIILGSMPLLGAGKSQRPEVMTIRKPGDMISLSIGYTHMVRTSAYEYTIEEKNGEVLFSASYFNDKDEQIIFDKVPVDHKYMDTARSIAGKHGFAEMKYKGPDLPDKRISDAPVYSLVMYFPKTTNGRVYAEAHRLNYHPAGIADVKTLFSTLAGIYFEHSTIKNL